MISGQVGMPRERAILADPDLPQTPIADCCQDPFSSYHKLIAPSPNVAESPGFSILCLRHRQDGLVESVRDQRCKRLRIEPACRRVFPCCTGVDPFT